MKLQSSDLNRYKTDNITSIDSVTVNQGSTGIPDHTNRSTVSSKDLVFSVANKGPSI